MSIDAGHVATRLAATLGSGHGTPGPGWLWPTLLRQLATGRPVTLDDLAQHSGRSSAEVRDGLAALSDTEYDEQGRVVGHGITLRPTPHHFTVGGQQLYTWCALDTLIFPTILGRLARVVSPTPGSGDLVRLDINPAAGITACEPATAVMSVLVPDAGASVRSAFCNQVHFFTTPTAAQGWLAEHPGGSVLRVGEAVELGRRLAQDLLDGPPGRC
ncbi:MAG: organomercurial lyase MerB [Pseudonocardiaceae bacterium]